MDILSCVRGSVTPGSRPFTIRRQGPSFTETNDPELPEGKRAQQDAVLIMRIRAVHETPRGTYGVPRMHAELADRGGVGTRGGAQKPTSVGFAPSGGWSPSRAACVPRTSASVLVCFGEAQDSLNDGAQKCLHPCRLCLHGTDDVGRTADYRHGRRRRHRSPARDWRWSGRRDACALVQHLSQSVRWRESRRKRPHAHRPGPGAWCWRRLDSTALGSSRGDIARCCGSRRSEKAAYLSG